MKLKPVVIHIPEDLTPIIVYNPKDEVDPRDADMTPEGVRAIWEGVVRLYRTGVHPAISLCLRKRGKIVLKRTIGHAKGNGPDAFGGHIGLMNIHCWADPAREISVALINTGKALLGPHLKAHINLLNLIAWHCRGVNKSVFQLASDFLK